LSGNAVLEMGKKTSLEPTEGGTKFSKASTFGGKLLRLKQRTLKWKSVKQRIVGKRNTKEWAKKRGQFRFGEVSKHERGRSSEVVKTRGKEKTHLKMPLRKRVRIFTKKRVRQQE